MVPPVPSSVTFFFFGIEGEVLLGNLVDGLLVADLLGRDDAVGGDADVVAVEQLDDQVQIVEGLAAGQDHADEGRAAVVGDLDLAPDADLVLVQQLSRGAAVALEAVGALAEGDACCRSSAATSLRASP